MYEHREQRLVHCPASHMFEVIANVERYPEFLPGWRSVHIRERDGNTWAVAQSIGLGPLVWNFISTTTIEPPSKLTVESHDGPFRDLHIHWTLEEAESHSCLVKLEVRAVLSSTLNTGIMRHVLGASNRRLLSLFEHRALTRPPGSMQP